MIARQVEAQAIAFAREARNVDLTPWFAKNRETIESYVKLIQHFSGRQTGDLSGTDRASRALAALTAAIEKRQPDQLAWLQKYRSLLSVCAEMIVELAQVGTSSPDAQREPPAPSPVAVPEVVKVPQVTEEQAVPDAPDEGETPPQPMAAQVSVQAADLTGPGARLRANARAINILAKPSSEPLSAEDRAALLAYSGNGGLSIEALAELVPQEWVPETRGLINEYYTPSIVAEAIAQAIAKFIPDLLDGRAKLRGLEPSAGIGRFVTATSLLPIDWNAVEYSKVSATLLGRLWPDVSLYQGPFEQWVVDNVKRFDIVISNPPYGQRGAAAQIDRAREYASKKAHTYFLFRCLDLLTPRGIGVFVLPAGVLTGTGASAAADRRRMLGRSHLMAAYRLPSHSESGKPLFPGAAVVADVIFLRSRGGESPVPESDEFIVQGKYYEQYPGHVLGQETTDKGSRFGYKVVGDFVGLPDVDERPSCRECLVTPLATKGDEEPTEPVVEVPESVVHAKLLAQRVSRYLSDVSIATQQSLRRASLARTELRDQILNWHSQPRETTLGILQWQKTIPALSSLLSVLGKDGKLIDVLENTPAYTPRFLGSSSSVQEQADYLWRTERRVTISRLLEFNRELGGSLTSEELASAASQTGWCIDDGDLLLPEAVYYSGAMWPRYDRALQRAESDPIAALQAERLLQKIKPATYSEIEVEPRLGWIPLVLIEKWIAAFYVFIRRNYIREPYRLERLESGLITLVGMPYEEVGGVSDRQIVLLLGYLNHDLQYFRPSTRLGEDLEEKRLRMASSFREHFREWLEGQVDLQKVVVEAFNRLFRGWLTPGYDSAPLEITDWNPDYPLYPYQNSGVRRLNANNGGGLFYDVGLGKTRTTLAALALARQQGLSRRPVIVVPNSVVYNWVREIALVLPDYRVVLIGAKLTRITRGKRKGQLTSETDTAAERVAKWDQFKAGLFDVAIVTYSMLGRTRLSLDSIKSAVSANPAMLRQIAFEVRALEDRLFRLTRKKDRRTEEEEAEFQKLKAQFEGMKSTERKEAIKEERIELFAARVASLPAGSEFDGSHVWDELGIDWLAFDEAHVGKNLYTVGSREGGIPRFLGAPTEGSDIAWQMYFRAAVVRKTTGGAGVHLADATPAKNSPLEFLAMLSLIDGGIWQTLGIRDTEQFLSQYLDIEIRLIQTAGLQIESAPCVVGFRNLDQLREVLFRYGEFRTAKQVGLIVPEPVVETIDVAMNDEQESKYMQYLATYEALLSSHQSKAAALGILVRMSQIAVHHELDNPEWTYANAHLTPDFRSPKLEKIAELVSKRNHCGHLIFLESLQSQVWLKRILVESGIPAERIAILNGVTAPSALARQRIAEGFTSDDALYDVIIANKIAEQGLNLQNRTCAIYHGDLPWEPATIQQRNGRGLRQGNKYTTIAIYFLMSARSLDWARFELIRGKAGWLTAILESSASTVNNPAAQTNLSPEEWLLRMSRDPAKTQKLMAKRKAELREEELKKASSLAWAKVRSISLRIRDSQNANLFARTRLMEEVELLATELLATPEEYWPYRSIIPAITTKQSLTFGRRPGVVWEGANLAVISEDGKLIDGGLFGRIRSIQGMLVIGYRLNHGITWEPLSVDQAARIFELSRPTQWHTQSPEDHFGESSRALYEDWLARIRSRGPEVYRSLRLDLAPDSDVVSLWERYGSQIVASMGESWSSYSARIPVNREGLLAIQAGAILGGDAVLPPTDAGYQVYLSLAQTSSIDHKALESCASWWWGRALPTDLLTQKIQNAA